ncbi:hypothetical protein SAMN05421809_1151 [Natronorubrum daqingense]|uniref:Uncharacterized protein n=1 Tax=Natronorubrum daqingense TaxID=588898 RepID=A0A1N7AFS2_9EURY|nr:hypothetical protein SAMN05421809_1151 [Natronorubrum daqingense]
MTFYDRVDDLGAREAAFKSPGHDFSVSHESTSSETTNLSPGDVNP